VAGVAGLTLTARLAGLLDPQLFVAVTVIFPFWPAAPDVTEIEVPVLLPCIDHPAGTAQLYEVALGTEPIE
jgi:hypothetical protein